MGRRRYRDVMSGVKGNIIRDATTVSSFSGYGSPQFPALPKRTSENSPDEKVYGDPVYLSIRNWDIVKENGGKPLLKPKRNKESEEVQGMERARIGFSIYLPEAFSCNVTLCETYL